MSEVTIHASEDLSTCDTIKTDLGWLPNLNLLRQVHYIVKTLYLFVASKGKGESISAV